MEGRTPQKAKRTAGKQFCCSVIGGASLLGFGYASRVTVGGIKSTKNQKIKENNYGGAE